MSNSPALGLENMTYPTSSGLENITNPNALGFFHPILIIFLFNMGSAFLVNIFVLFILQRQQAIDDTSRLLYKASGYLQLILTLTWGGWCIGWNVYRFVEKTCKIICYIFTFVTISSLIAQMFCYSFISICKLILITRPLRYHLILTPLKVKIVLSVIILVSIIGCTPLLPWSNTFSSNIASDCLSPDSLSNVDKLVLRITTALYITPIAIALIITTTTNFALLGVTCQQKRRVEAVAEVAPRNDGPQGERRRRARVKCLRCPRKGIATILTLTVSFYACWFCWIVTTESAFGDIIQVTGGVSGWLQPLLYIATSKEAKDIASSYLSRLRRTLSLIGY